MPPAPGRFSSTIGWPTCFESWSSTMRATMSLALPAANGTIAADGAARPGLRMGLIGRRER
jgi:hypothetical protein